MKNQSLEIKQELSIYVPFLRGRWTWATCICGLRASILAASPIVNALGLWSKNREYYSWANVLKRQDVVSATSWFFYCLNFSNRDACGARFCPNCPLKKPISFPVHMSVALCFPFPNRLVSETETSTASLSFRLNKAKYHSPVFALRDVIATFPSLLNT